MPTRVIALVIACVLLWSGFGAIEPLQPDAAPAVQLAAGSVVDHHLDDQPSQLQSEPGSQNPGLLPAPASLRPVALSMAAPHPFLLGVLRTPYLAGLLRPPCGACTAA
jgi:hypothetical protein